ncbi:MAG: leucine-rich repeat domain-containing protein [Holosporales bacterium]|jgi:hypothetical protein|nr:leucine-rich repeat domain-containing protein [Holosporales bacterium]
MSKILRINGILLTSYLLSIGGHCRGGISPNSAPELVITTEQQRRYEQQRADAKRLGYAIIEKEEDLPNNSSRNWYICNNVSLDSLCSHSSHWGIKRTLERVIIEEERDSLPGWAFADCSNLKEVVLPDSITSIKCSTFSGCKSLVMAALPSSVTSIEAYAFEGCTSLALETLPDNLTSIRNHAFKGCTSLALKELPTKLASIGYSAFEGCTSLALTILPDSLTSIEKNAFEGCTSLALRKLPAGLTSIEWGTFMGCTSLALTELPPRLTYIDCHAFSDCTRLDLFTLPDGVVTVGESAFCGCTGLKEIHIPSSVKNIGAQAFGKTRLRLLDLSACSGVSFRDWVTVVPPNKIVGTLDSLFIANELYILSDIPEVRRDCIPFFCKVHLPDGLGVWKFYNHYAGWYPLQ